MEQNWLKQIVDWINDYVDVAKLSADVKVALVARFEELMETDTVPEVIKQLYNEFKDDYALSVDEISAIIIEYISQATQNLK